MTPPTYHGKAVLQQNCDSVIKQTFNLNEQTQEFDDNGFYPNVNNNYDNFADSYEQ